MQASIWSECKCKKWGLKLTEWDKKRVVHTHLTAAAAANNKKKQNQFKTCLAPFNFSFRSFLFSAEIWTMTFCCCFAMTLFIIYFSSIQKRKILYRYKMIDHQIPNRNCKSKCKMMLMMMMMMCVLPLLYLKCSPIFESEILISTVYLAWNSKEIMKLEIKNVYSIEWMWCIERNLRVDMCNFTFTFSSIHSAVRVCSRLKMKIVAKRWNNKIASDGLIDSLRCVNVNTLEIPLESNEMTHKNSIYNLVDCSSFVGVCNLILEISILRKIPQLCIRDCAVCTLYATYIECIVFAGEWRNWWLNFTATATATPTKSPT